jgi:hypothetical protein
MSGGSFEYKEYQIEYIADEIEAIIKKNGRKKEPNEKESWDEETHHHKYHPQVISELKKGVEILRKAHIYAHEIDWLISGDTGEESFLENLKEKLEDIQRSKK